MIQPHGMEFSTQEIPEEFADEVKLRREKMIETLAEVDDDLADKYLGGEEITAAEIEKALRKATISLKIVPVLCGAALRNKGIQPVLDADHQLSAVSRRCSAH
jgi:elongation factor G